jgi:pyridoxamine 5'-phosphate oxidase
MWKELERQVRIEGSIEKVTPRESSAYYDTRPLGSRIGAWASPQSEAIENRGWLEKRWEELSTEYGENPTRPALGRLSRAPRLSSSGRDAAAACTTASRITRAEDRWKLARLAP